MYVGYVTEECCGNTFFTPVCILRNDKELKEYLSISNRKIDFEECEILDLKSIEKSDILMFLIEMRMILNGLSVLLITLRQKISEI